MSEPNKGQGPKGGVPRPSRTLGFWFIMVILMILAYQFSSVGRGSEYPVSYSAFMKQLERDNLQSVLFDGSRIRGSFRESIDLERPGKEPIETRNFRLTLPFDSPDLLETIRLHSSDEMPIQIETREPGFRWGTMLLAWGPILLLILLWFFFIRQMQGGSNRAFSFGKSRAKLVGGDKPVVTFEDVAGAEEAKVELLEIVEFLSDPKKFQKMGARIPRGVLLVGPPGTGKTLLAKAVAGEARVPFFQMSGSDFVEMFVGVGASRVRDLFEQGKKNAPCIIFVDELDAVGRQRGAGLGGGHDEREQTLNQLLVEMDGFDTSEGVILLAATNRPDVLDPALLRPGRFDRQVVVDMPDVKGREGILKVHLRKIPLLAEDVDVEVLAKSTPGLSGADLANIVNEGALLAARRNHDRVYMSDMEDAKDKILLGPERKSRVLQEETRRIIAYHEAGHAIAGMMLPRAETLHKVTIIARGRAEGVTYFLPKEDSSLLRDKEYLLDNITMALGGLCAEKLIFKQMTNGASGDIRHVTQVARQMITQWGMSDPLGPISYGENQDTVFLGRSFSQSRNFSEHTAQVIDEEVRKLVESCEARCAQILSENEEGLHRLVEALLERETLSGEEARALLEGEELAPFDREALEESRRVERDMAMSTTEKVDAVLEMAEQLEGEEKEDPLSDGDPDSGNKAPSTDKTDDKKPSPSLDLFDDEG